MNVQNLIELLQKLPDKSLEVYLAGDDEGNYYRRLYYAPGEFLTSYEVDAYHIDIHNVGDVCKSELSEFRKVVVIG